MSIMEEHGYCSSSSVSNSVKTPGSYEYHCSKCSYKSNYLNAFRLHAVGHGSTFYTCDFCAFETNRNELFLVHKETHVDQKKYFCSKCGYKTCIPATILRHKCLKVQCSKCTFITNSINKLKLHFFSHLAGVSSSNNKHVNDQHSDNPKVDSSFYCSSKNGEIKEETNSVSENVNETKDSYTYPAAVNCSEIKVESITLKCSVCDFEAKSKGSLRLHSLLHKNESSFMCSKCSFVTNFRNLLELHEKSHEDEAKYSCSSDAILTNSGDNLAENNAKLPREDDQTLSHLKCPICKFGSTTEFEYLDHLKSHNVDNVTSRVLKTKYQYQCCLCDFETNTMVTYQKHLLGKHNLRIPEGEITTIVGTNSSLPNSATKSKSVEEAFPNTLGESRPARRRKKKKPYNYDETGKRQYVCWKFEEKREIYWCHMYAKKTACGNSFKAERRKMLEQRGIVARSKLSIVNDGKLQGLVAILRVGRGGLSKQDLQKIEEDVSKVIEPK